MELNVTGHGPSVSLNATDQIVVVPVLVRVRISMTALYTAWDAAQISVPKFWHKVFADSISAFGFKR